MLQTCSSEKIATNNKGFTFIELMVAIAMLGIVLGELIYIFSPFRQLNKAYDTQRVYDLNTIATALDTYYNDKYCYPTSIPFGQQWVGDKSVIYMQKVPNDPQLVSNSSYVYLTDTISSCPQWNVLFSKLSASSTDYSCKLPTNCYPQNYDSSWACKASGNVDCKVILSLTLPVITPTSIAFQSQPTPPSGSSESSKKITICNAEGNGVYSDIQVSKNASVDGHDNHPNDIIPPFSYSCATGMCQYPGKNWDTNGQAIFNNNCVAVQSLMPVSLSYTGSDGSTCEEATPPNSYADELNTNWWCKDSTGFDSTKDGLNTCQAVSGNAAVYRFPCGLYQNWDYATNQITSLTAKCIQTGIGDNFNYQQLKWEAICSQGWSNASICQNNGCDLASKKTSVAPIIQVISPTDYSSMNYPPGPSPTVIDVVIRLISSSDAIRFYYIEDDEGQGGGGTSCSQINATDWDCSLMTWPKSLRNGNSIRTINVFAVDNSGNTGYAVTHVKMQ